MGKSYRTCRNTFERSGSPRRLCIFYTELDKISDIRPTTSSEKIIQSYTRQSNSNNEFLKKRTMVWLLRTENENEDKERAIQGTSAADRRNCGGQISWC